MRILWKALRYAPPGLLTAVKRATTPRFRLWIRERLGADHKSIPNKVIAAPDGRRFRIGPDRIYWPLFIGLEYEPEATSIVRRILREGDTVVDAGANYGWYATLAARIVSRGRVLAFEPVRSTYERLRENLELNGLSGRVDAINSALGEHSLEQTTMHLFDGHSCGRASLSPLEGVGSELVETSQIRLGEVLQDEGIERVDFLKCDVEGAELMVLRGARDLLGSDQAPIVLVELNEETTEAFGYHAQEIWDLLEESGYDHFYKIESADTLGRLPERSRDISVNLLVACKGTSVEDRMAEEPRQALSPAA